MKGPMIEQDTARVSHRDGLADLARTGRDLETVVLARAVRLHLSDRVLVYGHKTVVFSRLLFRWQAPTRLWRRRRART